MFVEQVHYGVRFLTPTTGFRLRIISLYLKLREFESRVRECKADEIS